MQSTTVLHALVAATLLVPACDPYVRSTVITTRDPSEVAVQDADSEARVPVGRTPTEPVEVARTEVWAGPSSTSDLIVTATRRPNGALVTEWQTRLPLVNGERHTLVDQAGSVTLDGHVPIDTSNDLVTVPVCGTLATKSVKTVIVGYDVRPATPCAEPHMVQINLQTARSNVVAIHHVSKNSLRAPAIFVAVVNTALFGGIGSLTAFGNLPDMNAPDQVLVRGIGVGLIAVAAAIDITFAPAIFGPDHDEVVYP